MLRNLLEPLSANVGKSLTKKSLDQALCAVDAVTKSLTGGKYFTLDPYRQYVKQPDPAFNPTKQFCSE